MVGSSGDNAHFTSPMVLAGSVCTTPPAGLLQPPLRGDRCEQSAEASSSPEGSVPLQRPASGECALGAGHKQEQRKRKLCFLKELFHP